MENLKGKLAIVTGADGGIGMEFCRALARRGATLLMVSVTSDPLIAAAGAIHREYDTDAYPLTLDLCRKDAPDVIQAWLESHNLEAHILINNAGIFSFAEVCTIPEKKVDCFIDLHVRAATALSIRFAQLFKAQGGGYILNMSSMSCWMPMPGIAMYSATKAYIRVFSRALHYEMRPYGVNVMAACPGGIATDLFGLPDHLKKLALRLGAIARADRFAEAAVKRLLKGRKQYINGLTNRLAILFVASLPTALRMQVKHRLLDRGITKP